MKKNYFLSLAIVLIFLGSCSQDGATKPNSTNSAKIKVDNNRMMYSTLYVQFAAEYKALAFQSYNLAKYRLKDIVKKNKSKKKLAVVLDIDETVLDNSPQFGKQILDTVNYPDCWDEWVTLAQAETIPGVKSFLSLADSLGVKIFYISNRKIHLLDPTIKNLRAKNLPQVDSASILLRTGESTKEPRRQQIITKGYEICLLMGDNLGDFSEIFQVKDNAERNKIVTEHQNDFGDKFIVLPNAVYGKWQGTLGFFKKGINIDSLARTKLKTFECK